MVERTSIFLGVKKPPSSQSTKSNFCVWTLNLFSSSCCRQCSPPKKLDRDFLGMCVIVRLCSALNGPRPYPYIDPLFVAMVHGCLTPEFRYFWSKSSCIMLSPFHITMIIMIVSDIIRSYRQGYATHEGHFETAPFAKSNPVPKLTVAGNTSLVSRLRFVYLKHYGIHWCLLWFNGVYWGLYNGL